ncbi:MAG: hypothetical protein ACKVVP_10470 [Chloroflexota bacterium]
MTYHVTLAGQGLLLDLQSYKRSLAEPFAGKLVSGDLSYGSLRDEMAVLIDDWSGGEGYTSHDPDEPGHYRKGPGLDPWTEPGAVRQGPALASAIGAGLGDVSWCPTVNALGKLYVGVDAGKCLTWDGISAVTAFTLTTGTRIAAMVEYQGKMYIGKTGANTIATWDGTTYTDVFLTLPAPVTACYSMGVFYRGSVAYLYLVGEAPSGCRIYYTDGVSLSTLRYQLNEPSCRVQPQVIGTTAVFFGVRLGNGAKTGVYTLRDNGSLEQWAFTTTLEGVNLFSGSVLGDASYLVGERGTGMFPEVYRWRNGQMERVTHTLSEPYLGSTLTATASGRGGFWLGFADGSGVGMKRYDGAQWSEPFPLTYTLGRAVSAAFYNGDLYFLTYLTGATNWYLWRLRSDLYAAAATLETGLIDARLPGITKVWRSVTVTFGALLSGQSVQVLYQLDETGAWVSLGTQSTVGATSASFTFAAALTGKMIAFRVVLTGVGGATAPVRLLSLEARCRPAAGAKRVWEWDCLIEGSAQMPMVLLDGSNSPQTSAQLSAALWSLAGQAGPLTYVDLDGVTRSVWLLEYTEKGAKMSQKLGTQLRGSLRLLEA